MSLQSACFGAAVPESDGVVFEWWAIRGVLCFGTLHYDDSDSSPTVRALMTEGRHEGHHEGHSVLSGDTGLVTPWSSCEGTQCEWVQWTV